MPCAKNGFTLVELAIVLMIIGLLIGGILKGQELITNARITSSIQQLKNYDAAALTFQDSYNALPGDMTTPSTRLPNCSSSPCNTAGNGNGVIGVIGSYNNENMVFWLHLVAANLISGVNTEAALGDFFTQGPRGRFAMGGAVGIWKDQQAPSATYPQGIDGPSWYVFSTGSGVSSPIPATNVAKLDIKIDDGKPFTGTVVYSGDPACGVTVGVNEYGANNLANCAFTVRSQFHY